MGNDTYDYRILGKIVSHASELYMENWAETFKGAIRHTKSEVDDQGVMQTYTWVEWEDGDGTLHRSYPRKIEDLPKSSNSTTTASWNVGGKAGGHET